MEEQNIILKCIECQKQYSNKGNLRKHIKRKHENGVGNEKSLVCKKYKMPEMYSYNCNCGKNFNNHHNYQYHLKSHKPSEDGNSDHNQNIYSKICSMCPYTDKSTKNLIKHFQQHDIVIKTQILEFSSQDNFNSWKNETEKNTNSYFPKKYTNSSIKGITTFFLCNRSGNYVEKETEWLRSLKTRGTNKINAFCPASINMLVDNEGKCTVKYTETHVGHVNDLGHFKHENGVENENSLVCKKYKTSEMFSYNCDCGKNFNNQHHFQYHLKSHKPSEDGNSDHNQNIDSKKCSMCPYTDKSTKNLIKHFQLHDVVIKTQSLEFSSQDNFYSWKNETEKNTNSYFPKKYTNCSIKGITTFFLCNRSGNYVEKETERLRRLKTQGTNKINAFCPASINMLVDNDGKCTVKYTETHVGHVNDLEHLFLMPFDRRQIATKIALKIPFETILDDIRDSVTNSTLDRIHLLTKKDLYNIKNSFNLQSDSIRHSNDCVSVEAWINEYKDKDDMYIFYKSQETVNQQYPQLKPEEEQTSKQQSILDGELDANNELSINIDTAETEYLGAALTQDQYLQGREIEISREKEYIKADILQILDEAKTLPELKIIKKKILSLRPTLSTVRATETKMVKLSTPRTPHNMSITPQRRFFNTQNTIHISYTV